MNFKVSWFKIFGMHFQCFWFARLDYKLARALAIFTIIFPGNGLFSRLTVLLSRVTVLFLPANGHYFAG